MLQSIVKLACSGSIGVLFAVAAAAAQEPGPRLDVPYFPTPPAVVDAMLRIGEVGPKDVLIDLGSGDGRIPIAAARRFGTRALGIDINPLRIEEARANAASANVETKVRFEEGDLFAADLSRATVITLYLLPDVNLKLRPKLLALKPGTRIVSHDFDMGEWKPARSLSFGGSTVFRWTVPARVEGQWLVTSGRKRFTLHVAQSFDAMSGEATRNGKTSSLSNARVDGAAVDFTIALDQKRQRFRGTYRSDGTLSGKGWSARRISTPKH